MDNQRSSSFSASCELADVASRLEATLTLSTCTAPTCEDTSSTTFQTYDRRTSVGDNELQTSSSSPCFGTLAGLSDLDDDGSAGRDCDKTDIASNNTTSTSTPTCRFLVDLPGELRTYIYELVLYEPSQTIVVDLRKDIDVGACSKRTSSANMLLACKQIHEECGNLRYAINKVHIFVPVFSTASAATQEERERRDLIASRLQFIADMQLTTRQLRRVRLFLGRLSRLSHLRWIEFFSSWMGVRDAIVCLSGICSNLELSFEVHLASDVTAQHKFVVENLEDKSGSIDLVFSDGSVAEITELERERLRRMKDTIFKTLKLQP